MIPGRTLERIVESWLATFDSREQGFAFLEAASGIKVDTWRKRLSHATESGRTGIEGRRGWYPVELNAADVDEVLVAMDATHLWHVPPLARHAPPRRDLRCFDCRRVIEPLNGAGKRCGQWASLQNDYCYAHQEADVAA